MDEIPRVLKNDDWSIKRYNADGSLFKYDPILCSECKLARCEKCYLCPQLMHGDSQLNMITYEFEYDECDYYICSKCNNEWELLEINTGYPEALAKRKAALIKFFKEKKLIIPFRNL